LEAIAPPYTAEFVQLFLPMVENEEITGTMRGENENDLVSEFISKYDVQKLLVVLFVLLHIKNKCILFFSSLQDTLFCCKMTV